MHVSVIERRRKLVPQIVVPVDVVRFQYVIKPR